MGNQKKVKIMSVFDNSNYYNSQPMYLIITHLTYKLLCLFLNI